ncbi:sensor histidine kinase [Actinosynnema sp. CS-041913]|uniref:sensor histidine kinase n=1 Tax=Actinosynnema sp. CS-041913 TaxID=3239917 RepID=UPI003D89C1A5
MRRSIFTRLLGVTVLLAMCSIAATAWLVAQITRGSIEQEQGRELAVDNNIYSTLLGYAATHPNWNEVTPVVQGLAAQHPNRRIALLTRDRRPIADVGGGGGPLPATASAVIDPLAVDPVLVPDAARDRIDRRALGPFWVPADQRAPKDHTGTLKCLRNVALIDDPAKAQGEEKRCLDSRMPESELSDLRAVFALEELVNVCLDRRGLLPVELDPSLTWQPKFEENVPRDEQAIGTCVTTTRQEQLAPYVTQSALLFVTSPAGAPTTTFDLSEGNWRRIAAVALAILLVAVLVTAAACARLIRPLRALTGAAHRVAGGDTPQVVVKGKDELAQLASAFNTMSAARARMERLRKAMVSDIAHELRTPLSNIRGWLEAAEDGISERDPALIALLLKEALMLQHVVDDLQDLAAADAGELRLSLDALDAGSLLAQLRSAHGPRATQNGITLSVASQPGLMLRADALRLRQILDNLVTNALRQVPGGGSIAVTARADGHTAVIDVADTGTGISAEDLPHVFDRFWRAEKSRSRQTGGSGLGLAIVRKLTEAHGGDVTAVSAEGQGTTFTLRLPNG